MTYSCADKSPPNQSAFEVLKLYINVHTFGCTQVFLKLQLSTAQIAMYCSIATDTMC